MKPPRTYQYVVIAAILTGYVAIRFWNLTTSCLWFDEIFSIHAAEHPWNSLFSFVALDLIHPPLFYVLLKLWIGAGGESLFWLRLFPVLFSILAIFPFVALCRELKLDLWPTIIALFFFAVNGSLIKYAQEVRMYSLLMCLSLFSIWLFTRYFQKGKSFVPLLIVNILMVYSHYFGWFVIAAEVFAILIFQRARTKRILLMFAVVFVSFVPWIFAVWHASSTAPELGQNIGWMVRPGPVSVGQVALNLIEPFYYSASSVDPISIYRVSLPVFFIAVVAMALYLGKWKQRSDDERQTFKLLSVFVALPLIIAFTASWILPYSIWGARHLIIVFAPVSILLAVALNKLPTAVLKTSALTLILLFTGYAFMLASFREPPQYIWCAWEQLANQWFTAPHHSSEPKTLYAFEELVAYHFWYSTRDFENYRVKVVKGIEGIKEDPAYFLPRGFDSVQIVDDKTAFSGDSFWIAFRDPDPDGDLPDYSFLSSRRRPQIFSIIEKRGFEIDDVRKIKVGNETAFVAKMIRDPRTTPNP